MKETFADKVRKIYRERAGRDVNNQQVCILLDLVFDSDKRILYAAQRDMRARGELVRVRPGVHVYKGKKNKPELQEIMWRILRARRTVSVADLVEMAGAKESYVLEWLHLMVRRGIVRKNSPASGIPKYTMISDPVEMPRNDKKADRLWRMRAEKKKALAAIDQVVNLALQARMAVNDIQES